MKQSILVVLLCALGAPVGATDVPASIDSDTTWNATGSPYFIAADASAARGVTLTIEPGVTVQLGEGISLTIEGELIARGTEASPITFTGIDVGGTPAHWGSLKLEDSAIDAVYENVDDYVSGSILEWVIFEHASRALHLKTVPEESNAPSPYVHRCTFRNNVFSEKGENLGGAAILAESGAAPRIRSCTFEDNTAEETAQAGAINADFSHPVIQDCVFKRNFSAYGGAVVTTITASPVVGNTFEDNTTRSEGGAISLVSSVLAFMNNHVEGNYATFDGGGVHVCVTCFPHSTPFFMDNTIINNTNEMHGAAGFGAAFIREFAHNNVHGNTMNLTGEPADFAWHNNEFEHYRPWVTDPVAPNNWWGTTDTAAIDETIHDGNDDDKVGKVRYQPVRTEAVVNPTPRVTVTTRRLKYEVDDHVMPVYLTMYNPGAEREVDLVLLLRIGDGPFVEYRGALDFPGATQADGAFRLTLPENSAFWAKLIEPGYDRAAAALDEGSWHAAIFDAATGERIGDACSIRVQFADAGGTP